MTGVSAIVGEGLRLLWKHRWTFGVPVATLLLPAALFAVHLPDTFKASATVSVARVNVEKAGGSLSQGEEERGEQMILSARDRLLAKPHVLAMLGVLKPDADTADPVVVVRAKERVQVEQMGDTGIRVSIEDVNPDKAARAVNALTASFLATERANRVQKAKQVSEFLARELAAATKAKALQDDRLEAWRREHKDALPNQVEFLAAEIARAESAARDKESQATNAKRLMQEYDKLIRQAPTSAAGPVAAPQSAEEEGLALKLKGQQSVLEAAQKTLADLRTRYQDKWPAIQETLSQIRVIEADLERTKSDLDAARQRAATTTAARRTSDSQGLVQTLQTLRAAVAEEADRAEKEAAEQRKAASTLQARRAEADTLAPAYARLVADVADAEETRRRSEKEATNAERTAQFAATGPERDVIGYAIEEDAVPPALPSGPGRVRLLLTAALLGLAIGYGLFVLRRRARGGEVWAAEDLADLLPSALVVRVPLLEDDSGRMRRTVRETALAGWTCLCLLGTAFALAAHKGWVTPPPWFRSWLGGGA